ncbi:MAG: hypothetical protein ACKO3H_08645 [Verrucomicrobiota bacterium]
MKTGFNDIGQGTKNSGTDTSGEVSSRNAGKRWLWVAVVWLGILAFYVSFARPYFGPNSDAVYYLAGAESFADGHGYRFPMFPGTPPIPLYPPGLSLAFTPVFWGFPTCSAQIIGCLTLLVAVTLVGVPLSMSILLRLGVPIGLASLATLSIIASPHWFLTVCSLGSDTPFAVLTWFGGWWWLRNQQTLTPWSLLPVAAALFLAQLFRSAGIALYVGLIAAELLQNRRRALWSVPVLGLSYLSAGLLRRAIIPAGGVGYMAEWGRLIQDRGGLDWYGAHVLENAWSFVSGHQLHELLWPWVARLPQIAGRYSANVSSLFEVALALAWIALLAMMTSPAFRRWRESRRSPEAGSSVRGSDYAMTFLLGLGATIGMLIVVPNDFGNFPRYLLWTSPFLVAALWNGIRSAVPSEHLRSLATIGALFLCLVTASDCWISRSILARANSNHGLEEGLAFVDEIKPILTQDSTVAAAPLVPWIHFWDRVNRPFFGNFYGLDLSTTPPCPWVDRATNCTFVMTHSMDELDGLAATLGWSVVTRSTGGRYALYRTPKGKR